MSDPSLVLVLGNDFSPAAARTSRHFCRALHRLGLTGVGRDTRLVRWAAVEAEKAAPERRQAFEAAVVSKWARFVFDYGIERIISVDLHWLFTPHLFIDGSHVKSLHSFWLGDLRSHLQATPMFPLGPRAPLEIINTSKVSHYCHARGQAEEMRLLGVNRVVPSLLAASEEYLHQEEPCTELNRLAFTGDPGFSAPPRADALKALQGGASRAELRRLARQEILDDLRSEDALAAAWVRQSPEVADLLAAAMEQRIDRPHETAISLLAEAGRAWPDAFDFLNRNGLMLDAALLVKWVNRYDRPALVHRLWKRGWLDVHGAPEQWASYGITAQPTVSFPRRGPLYRRYPVHLNVAAGEDDAGAHEKLFEIAACARASLNPDDPDVRACYTEGEAFFAGSDEAFEAAAEQIVRDPSAALAAGEKARRRTADEHLWEHRLQKALE